MADTMTAEPSVAPAPPGGIMRRLNILTGVLGGLVLGAVGWAIAYATLRHSDFGSDRVNCITMVCWLLGFTIGIGAFTGPVRWLLGKDLTEEEHLWMAGKDQGVSRYFRFTTDHKVIGIQYLVLGMVLFFVGGVLAMLIRTDLITPGSHLFGPQTYNSVVGLHGIIVIAATITMVSGPFGNFILVHLLITAVLGVAIWNRARRGLFSSDSNGHVRLVGCWWAWVAMSAILIAFTTSFVASPHVG